MAIYGSVGAESISGCLVDKYLSIAQQSSGENACSALAVIGSRGVEAVSVEVTHSSHLAFILVETLVSVAIVTFFALADVRSYRVLTFS